MSRFFIHRYPKGQPGIKHELVATFQPACRREAETTFATLQYVAQGKAAGNEYYHEWDYIFSQELARPQGMSHVDIEVDTSAAKPTRRPIVYNLSYETTNGKRKCLAYNRHYGTVRGTMSPDHSIRFFVERVKTVWPNAELTRT